MKKTVHYALLLFSLFCILLFSSCHKKTEDDPSTDIPTPAGTVMFHLHTYIQDNEVDLYNIPYTTHEGRNMSLSLAQLYISDVQLVKLDGSVYSIPTNKLLKILEKDTYLIGDAPVGNYKSLRFKVGLSPAVNLPDASDKSDSLMWLSSGKIDDGYTFLNVKGKIDTSDAMTAPMVPFEYKIGTNINYTQVNMPNKDFTVVAGEIQYAHIIADYYRLFNGIKLNAGSNLFIQSAADNTLPLAKKIVTNIPSMFTYEQ
jgi:hypothetical protein